MCNGRGLLAGLLLLALLLAACAGGPVAPGDTVTIPVSTPMLLGVTVEAPPDSAREPTPGAATGVIDPTLPAWTILYYASADNESAATVWSAINQMEAVGSSEQVRIVADVDWAAGDSRTGSEPVRYFIAGDTDPDLILSEGAALVAEANFGDPATLTDFLTWGINAFPAQRYALILAGYGGGWQGCCLDFDTGTQPDRDSLSSAEIGQALSNATQQTNRTLDVIAFGGSLMSQLDVLLAVQPYAAYAVASPDLVPGAGWDYQSLLGPLVADPSQDGRQLAAHMVADYVNYQRDLLGNPFVSMTATDLSRIPNLVTALETLGTSLSQAPEALITATQDARRGALAYGQAAARAVSLVDLQHAAAVLTAYAPTADLEIAARAVSVAVQEAAVAYDFGPGLPGARGISVFWPVSGAGQLASYTAASELTGWSSFIERFVVTTSSNEAPFVGVSADNEQPVSSSQPAVIHSEIIGRQLDTVQFVTSVATADGRRLLLQQERVPPPPATLLIEPPAYLWSDGRQTSGFIWDAVAGYLYDSSGASQTVALTTVNQAPGPGQLVVTGEFGRAVSPQLETVSLAFPLSNEVPSHIWHEAVAGDGTLSYYQLLPRPGDSFTPAQYLLTAGGRLEREPGTRLMFDDAGVLYRSARPLENGSYDVGVWGTALGGQTTVATVPLTVDSETVVEGFRSYVDGVNNIRFLYPVSWVSPAIVGEQVEAVAQDGSTRMRLQRFPDWTADSQALNQEVAATFGSIALLFQDEVPLGGDGQTAARTVYGYDSVDQGTRTGVLLTFVQDGTGYAIDIDGPQTDEAFTLAVSETMAGSWQRLPSENILNAWTSITVDGQRVQYPSVLAYQELNGWHRLSDTPQTFVAVRVQPAVRSIPEATTALLATAAEGVDDFTPSPTEQRFLAGHLWDHTSFTYRGADGEPVFGLLLLRQGPGQEIAVWAESPEGAGADEFARTVWAIAAGISPAPADPE